MTSAVGRSGRRSGRVEGNGTGPTEVRPLQPISAPGSMSPAGPVSAASSRAPAAPERRAKPAAKRSTRERLLLTARDLSDRERHILITIHDHHFLTTAQLELLFFLDHATQDSAARICRRTLRRLDQLRVIEHLERRVGGIRAGSASYVWRVGLVGDQLLRMAAGRGARARRKEPSARYLDHCLAVAEVRVALVLAERAERLELIRLDAEPACWRNYVGPGSSRQILKPDLYALTASDDYEDHWFIEVDRSTESIPTLLRKCQQYTAYRRTGREQQDGGVFPLVLWAVPDQARMDRFTAGLRSARGLDADLFRVATQANMVDLVTGDGP